MGGPRPTKPSTASQKWTYALPRPIDIPGVMTLKTLADVQKLIGGLPAATRAQSTWAHVSKQLDQAARSGSTVELAAALQIVMMMAGIEYKVK